MSETHVLLVEDDPLDAALARRALQSADVASIEHCSTLAATLERLADESQPRPTVILLDLTLPDCDGLSTFDRLSEAGSPPIVVMSGDDDPHRALTLIERGAQDYLVKGEMSGSAIARSLRQSVERARLIGDLEVARDQALEAARTKGAFVAAMSHEIRTPLNAILGMADLLAQTELDPDQREYVEIFRRCGRSLKGLLDNALELSRFETGHLDLAREPFELDALIHECLEAFAFAAHRKGIALIGDVREDAVGTVVGDEGRLRQVLFNLIGNAVKFTEAGRVLVRARSAEGGEGIEVDVVDTGIGIPEDRQAAIFERFVQAESGTTRRFGGSGLGLTLCRELVGAMHGRLGVESRPGAGSVFRLQLPLGVAPRRRDVDYGGQSLLVVMADSEERAVAVSRLRRHGAHVEEVGCVEDARERLATRVDAMLVDARLPGGGGIELLEQLGGAQGASLPQCVVVLLSMDHRVGDLARCEAVQAIAFCKPARWEDLDAALLAGRRPAPRGAASGSEVPSFAGRRILLAEDVAENQTIVLVHLERTGCEVVVAEDGRAAVERYAAEPFDLVLMDVHMPGMDGCEATRRIRAFEREGGRRRAPIVALTADALPEQRGACFAAGCDAHLGKPFTRADLYRSLCAHLPTEEGARRGTDEKPPPRETAARSAPFEPPRVPADLADLAESYLGNRRADAVALREAASECAFERARRLGHNMKGSGTGYGFRRVSELGAEIEDASSRGDREALERLAGELAEYAEKALASLS